MFKKLRLVWLVDAFESSKPAKPRDFQDKRWASASVPVLGLGKAVGADVAPCCREISWPAPQLFYEKFLDWTVLVTNNSHAKRTTKQQPTINQQSIEKSTLSRGLSAPPFAPGAAQGGRLCVPWPPPPAQRKRSKKAATQL